MTSSDPYIQIFSLYRFRALYFWRILIKYARMSAFIFDMDGVLFANSDFHIEAWIVYARKFGREITEEDVRSRLGWNNRDYMRFVFNREPTDEEVAHSVFDKEEVYRNICREHLVHPDGLLAFLEAAQAAGIKMGVATSAPTENVRFTLDGLDIRKYFEVVVDATQVTKSKPDPAIYLKAAEQLGVPPEKCIVFEDAIAGIQSGKAAGMFVIAITTSYPADVLKQHTPDAVIESFKELAQVTPAADLVAHVCGKRVL
jgi:beta-phosphoglucomutase family hydrolase